jgi:hypothetical protein
MSKFEVDPLSYITGPEEERSIQCFVSYFASYTGAWFNHLADSDRNTIGTSDLVAVSTLGVKVPAGVAVWLLQPEHHSEVSDLLAEIPAADRPDLPITDVPCDVLGPGSKAQRLWQLLQRRRWPEDEVKHSGLGPVTAGKLLAAKRPELIPVWDQWVQEALGPPEGQFWTAMWNRFQDDDFVTQLKTVREAALETATRQAVRVPAPPSLLRTLDIIVWMREYGHLTSLDPKVRALRSQHLGAA